MWHVTLSATLGLLAPSTGARDGYNPVSMAVWGGFFADFLGSLR